MKQQQADDIKARFEYRQPVAATIPIFEETRRRYAELAEFVALNVPDGRHQALALTELQESMLWANAATAIDYRGVGDK